MSNGPLRRLLKNAATLLSGNLAGAVFGFLSSLVAARALGPADLGVIVLVQSLVLGIDRLVNFQCWRAVIKYGSEALENEDGAAFAQVVKFGVVLDVVSASVGASLAFGVSFLAREWFDWDAATHRMAMIYAGVLLLHVTGAPIAVLRMFDYFRAFALQRLAQGLVKFCLIVAMAWADAPPWLFLGAWLLADAVGFASITVMGVWVYRRRGMPRLRDVPLRGVRDNNPGILGFAIITNASTAIRVASREADNFVIGLLLGTHSVGLYKIAKQFASVVAQAYDPLNHAIYPELARDVAAGRIDAFDRGTRFGALIASALAAVAWLGAWIFGEWALTVAVGEEYLGAYHVMLLYLGGTCLSLATFFVGPANLALGRPQAALRAVIVSTTIYFSVLSMLIGHFGLEGAGWAQIVLTGGIASWMLGELYVARRRWTPAPPDES